MTAMEPAPTIKKSIPDPFGPPAIGVLTGAHRKNDSLKYNIAGHLLANKYFEPFIGFVRREAWRQGNVSVHVYKE